MKNQYGKIVLSVLAVAGMAIMAYLFSLNFSSGESAFCNLGEGLSCDIVNKSAYAKVAGIPVSLLGFLYFLGILTAVWWRYEKLVLKAIGFLSIVFLGPALYLSYIEFFILQNICVFCEASKVLILAIIGVSLWALRPDKFSVQLISTAFILAALLAFFTYFIQASAGPGDTYNEFAQCLDEKGFVMYGSVTCLACAKQRALFGDAFQFVEEIECDPRNPHPETERCIAKKIEKTPTWIQENEEGSELYRFQPGWQPLEKLSEVSGCALPQE